MPCSEMLMSHLLTLEGTFLDMLGAALEVTHTLSPPQSPAGPAWGPGPETAVMEMLPGLKVISGRKVNPVPLTPWPETEVSCILI